MEIPDKIYISMIRTDTSISFIGTAWTKPQEENQTNIEYINKKSLINWLAMLASKTDDNSNKEFFWGFIKQLKDF